MLKIQKPKDGDPLSWETIGEEVNVRIILEDGEILDISQEKDRLGFKYLAIRTTAGVLGIYPEAANKITLRPIII